MDKNEFRRSLNQRIDTLVMSGLKTKAQKDEFNRLCKWHRKYVLNHLAEDLQQ